MKIGAEMCKNVRAGLCEQASMRECISAHGHAEFAHGFTRLKQRVQACLVVPLVGQEWSALACIQVVQIPPPVMRIQAVCVQSRVPTWAQALN